MNIFQKRNTPNETLRRLELLINLSHFGLDPKEWSLIQKTRQTFLIQNKETPQFCLKGFCDISKERGRWKEIDLLSL